MENYAIYLVSEYYIKRISVKFITKQECHQQFVKEFGSKVSDKTILNIKDGVEAMILPVVMD